MALRATNSDGSVGGAGLPAFRRLSSRRAERKYRVALQWSVRDRQLARRKGCQVV